MGEEEEVGETAHLMYANWGIKRSKVFWRKKHPR